jgi:hypothetical protein
MKFTQCFVLGAALLRGLVAATPEAAPNAEAAPIIPTPSPGGTRSVKMPRAGSGPRQPWEIG